jgi:hypothetical protein
METCLEREFEIEDLRHHSQELIGQLRDVLASGAAITPDPKRMGFYEVRHKEQTYYIYVSPGTGKVLLLAAWSPPEHWLTEVAIQV